MKQYFAETLQVISFENDVYYLQKKSHFFYDINHNTEPL